MPEKKVGEVPENQKHCKHPEHAPASMIVREPGVYEHTCPGCQQVTRFTIRNLATL